MRESTSSDCFRFYFPIPLWDTYSKCMLCCFVLYVLVRNILLDCTQPSILLSFAHRLPRLPEGSSTSNWFQIRKSPLVFCLFLPFSFLVEFFRTCLCFFFSLLLAYSGILSSIAFFYLSLAGALSATLGGPFQVGSTPPSRIGGSHSCEPKRRRRCEGSKP